MEFKKTIELQYKNIQAAALCKAKFDVRFYLCGIYVGDGFLASTNGHILLMCDEQDTKGMDLIIPSEAIDSLIKKVGKNPMMKTVYLHQFDDEHWLLQHNSSYELFKPVGGKFPDIKRVDLEKPTDIQFKEYPRFNLEYLNIFQKVAKIFNVSFPYIYPTTENDRAFIEINDDVHGVLMPCRI